MAESRLHRWSQQKAKAREDSEKPDVRQPEDAVESDSSEQPVEQSAQQADQPEEKKEPAELPPIESLDEDSDYSVFMSRDVDSKLRKLALRKLFKSPIYNIRDGLNDYDEDFTTFQELGDIITSDMKFHAERKKAEEEERRRLEAETQVADEVEETETIAGDDASPAEDEDDENKTGHIEVAEQSEPSDKDERSET